MTMRISGTGPGGGGVAEVASLAGVMSQLEEIAAAIEDSTDATRQVYTAVDEVEPLLRGIGATAAVQAEATRALIALTERLIGAVERVEARLAERPV